MTWLKEIPFITVYSFIGTIYFYKNQIYKISNLNAVKKFLKSFTFLYLLT